MICTRGYYIKVFVTKTRELRARITYPNSKRVDEITIGGERWRNGEFPEYREEMLDKATDLLELLTNKLERINAAEEARGAK